jgi:hypothetical protein
MPVADIYDLGRASALRVILYLYTFLRSIALGKFHVSYNIINIIRVLFVEVPSYYCLCTIIYIYIYIYLVMGVRDSKGEAPGGP